MCLTFLNGSGRWLSLAPHVVGQESSNDIMQTLEGRVAIRGHQLVGHLVSQHVESVGNTSLL